MHRCMQSLPWPRIVLWSLFNLYSIVAPETNAILNYSNASIFSISSSRNSSPFVSRSSLYKARIALHFIIFSPHELYGRGKVSLGACADCGVRTGGTSHFQNISRGQRGNYTAWISPTKDAWICSPHTLSVPFHFAFCETQKQWRSSPKSDTDYK